MLAPRNAIGLSHKVSGTAVRWFRTSSPAWIKVGDKIPSVKLFEGSPSDDVDATKLLGTGKNLVVTVPGAFSGGCSSIHVPGYIAEYSKFTDKGFANVFVVAKNDSFVMKAWAETFSGNPGLRFIADPSGELADKLDLSFDATGFFGNSRYKRAAFVVEDGSVTKTFIEPDNTSVKESAAEKVVEAV